MQAKKVSKVIAITDGIIIFSSSFITGCTNKQTFVVNTPTYPTKIDYEDFDTERQRYEEIDDTFLDNLSKFSIKSSSLILSDTDKEKNIMYSPNKFIYGIVYAS